MNELIKITKTSLKQDTEEINTVDARELHEFLESKRQFSNWITERIEKYDFVDGIDFCSFNNFVKRAKGSSVAKEYHLTIGMAKELGMVENNERGRQIRKYFIDLEKNPARELTKTDLAKMVIESEAEKAVLEQEKKLLETKIEQDKPSVDFADKFKEAKGNMLVTDVAKLIGTGQNRLYKFMRDTGIIMKGFGYTPYQKYFDAKYFTFKTGTHKEKGVSKMHSTLLVTPAGYKWLWMRWNGYTDEPSLLPAAIKGAL